MMFLSRAECTCPAGSLPEGITLPYWLAAPTAIAMREAMQRCLTGGGDSDAARAEAMARALAQHPALPMPAIRDAVEDLLNSI